MKTIRLLKRLDQLEEITAEEESRQQTENAVAELEAWYQARKEEFNSPQARKEREDWYFELLCRGEEFRRKVGEKIC